MPVSYQTELLLPGLSSCFDLAQTLDCGQAFRWRLQPDGSWRGVAHGRLLTLRHSAADILLLGLSPDDYHTVWQRYFDLDRDYPALQAALSVDPALRAAIAYAPGIRVLRQDPWETLCTFIISANNNIPRIKGIVERLCLLLGDPLDDGCHAFPTPAQLAAADEASLSPLRCGYRARYLLDAAEQVARGRLPMAEAAELPTAELRLALQGVLGVGPKVADCVLLFGFGRVECCPMDTWMRKVMATLYPDGLPAQLLPYAGLAQQYLFHYARSHPSLFPA